ncbi:MAG: peptidoglycan editing factor PgeF [Agathobacter sp.]|nr:peptidoglycan editing factor PgeF [Agathobacter sp.]
MKYQDFKWKDNNSILQVKEYELAEGAVLPLLHFPLLEKQDFVGHCFTTREGGVSQGIFSSLNLSFTRGDEKEAVLENYNRLAEALGVKAEQFVCSHQTHTTNVRRVGKIDCGTGVSRPLTYEDVDGLITNEPGVVLSTFYADCVPLYFVDPVHKAIGLSHSGWRGTVGRMGQKTLEAMNAAFGTDPKDVYATVGPSICQDCYEISRDVAEEFMKEFPGHEAEILWQKSEEKFHLNLWKCNEIVLTEAGILPEHLAVTNLCTCCNPKLLFSHRASQGKRGNLGAFLFIK